MKNQYILPRYQRDKINFILKQNEPFEDLKRITSIEKELLKIRGYIFKMPPRNSDVILLLSGGLDTVVIWDILMRIYKLNVYPLFIRRGQIRMPVEERSVDYFASVYQKMHPNYFHSPKKVTTFIPPLEIRWDITKFGTFPINEKLECRGIPMYSSLLSSYAVQYAYYLEIKYALKPYTIFCGYVPGDGRYLRYENLTSLRSNTYNIITLTGEKSWQFTALAIERELGFSLSKYDFVKYSHSYNIPIEHAYSCIKYSFYHCGICMYCKSKKELFMKARVIDKTVYLNSSRSSFLLSFYNKIALIYITFIFMLRLIYQIIANFLYFLKFRY